MEPIADSRWVAAKLATLSPGWTPDVARGRTLVSVARSNRHGAIHSRLLWAVAAAVMVVAAVPQSRAIAAELWRRLWIARVVVVRVDLSRVPLDTSIRTDGLEHRVADSGEAARTAGFVPRLPPPAVLRDLPSVSVSGPIEVTQTIRFADLVSALVRVGARDLDMPASWDGVTLRALVGPLVTATYPGGIEVIQAPPVRLDVPADFPLARFAEVALRIAGLSASDARRLGAQFASRPALLLDVPATQPTAVEITPHDDGFVFSEQNDDGTPRVTVVVARPERLYSVTTTDRELSLRIADTLQ